MNLTFDKEEKEHATKSVSITYQVITNISAPVSKYKFTIGRVRFIEIASGNGEEARKTINDCVR